MNRLGFLVLLTLLGVLSTRAPGATPVAHNERIIRFVLTVTNPTSQVQLGARAWLYAPRAGDPGIVSNLTVEAPHEVQKDGLGNRIVQIELGDVPSFATRVVQLEARIEPSPSRAGLPDPNAPHFSSPEPYIESDDPEIIAIAAKLVRATPLQTAEAIYEWVRDNLRYTGFTSRDYGAVYALRNRSGDCTEYAYLVAALARANGIPSVVLGGYVGEHSTVPRATDYHNWAELYVDGAWMLIDAQKEQFGGDRYAYVPFSVVTTRIDNAMHGNHRFRVAAPLKGKLND